MEGRGERRWKMRLWRRTTQGSPSSQSLASACEPVRGFSIAAFWLSTQGSGCIVIAFSSRGCATRNRTVHRSPRGTHCARLACARGSGRDSSVGSGILHPIVLAVHVRPAASPSRYSLNSGRPSLHAAPHSTPSTICIPAHTHEQNILLPSHNVT
jgi:hypothetical protein